MWTLHVFLRRRSLRTLFVSSGGAEEIDFFSFSLQSSKSLLFSNFPGNFVEQQAEIENDSY